MIIIKKILVPTDFSNAPAIGYALALANKHGAEVGVLHVLSSNVLKESFAHGYATEGLITPGGVTGAGRAPDLDSIFEKKRRIVHDFLQREIGSELVKSVKITPLIRFGKIFNEIMAAAKEEQADLIVMSRRSGLTLRGHLTDRIVKRAPCPVLSIHPRVEVSTDENERVPLNIMDKWAA